MKDHMRLMKLQGEQDKAVDELDILKSDSQKAGDFL